MVKANRGWWPDRSQFASLVRALRGATRPLDRPGDLDSLMREIGDARFVLLGEASHGTAEYYSWRTTITRRLIREKGFSFVAVEGDWPDCYRVNRFVKARRDAGRDARDVLLGFDRWPSWMWANTEVEQLVAWLREYNDGLPERARVGFYGLDVYSLWESLASIDRYLAQVLPDARQAALRAVRCFEPFGEDPESYARATRFAPVSCEDEVVELLQALRVKQPRHDGDGREGYFEAEQNAVVVRNAEAYYRAMVRGGPDSWNIRDRHMSDTLDRLVDFHGPGARAVVWEHNTHVGDARFTDMVAEGMINVGQLVREEHLGDGVYIVGFGSHHGTVLAGRAWEAEPEVMTVPPAQAGSWEKVLSEAGGENRLLLFSKLEPTPELLGPRGHRAIGVVYRPEFEQYGNYVPTVLPRRYDAFLYLHETHALSPLHPVENPGKV